MTRVLSNFEARTLQTLELVSCPQLHVPPIIQSFHQLANFKILSSNVTSWDVDAALTAANHPRLISFAAYNVNMPGGELPLGMQDPHFPPTLRTLHLSGMNVQTLPVTFPSMWPQAMFLMYEFCNLTVVPPVLTRMSSMVLSLAGNQLTDVPPELFYVMPLMNLDLSGNPLTNLPEIPASLIAQLGHPAPILYVLDLMYTRLESLPSWFSSLYRVKASFTPLCTKVMSGELSVIPLGSSPFYLDCVSADEIGMG
ncbi:hypothetical protein Poli38472_000358 [Pythium oligandrum]|uniref:Uncharacterized protein n=1 Tax=Pythium oligandrum TaxID=41045 RepID=A0A8K1FF95_PYTOL|nr:hypothetical protein Poli38472_000358 [Pythium oligandrum]|eukprot:TMW60316.1 hypothetical protein Poli38472_000358 [Pythium oligandrum]